MTQSRNVTTSSSDNFVNFPNPKPRWDLFPTFLFCAGGVLLLLFFIVVAALIERLKQRNEGKRNNHVAKRPILYHKPSAIEESDEEYGEQEFAKSFCGSSKTGCCGCRLGAIRFILRPYFLIMEFIAMGFMIQIYRRDDEHHKSYIFYEWCNPLSYLYSSIAIIFCYQVASTILAILVDVRNAQKRSASIAVQFFGFRALYQMFHEVVSDSDSQEMMEVALIQALLFSFPALLCVTIFAFEAFVEAGNQSTWYAIMYMSMFLSSINIARGVNYRDKYGLIRPSLFWNFILVTFRVVELLLRVFVLAGVAAYFNKTILSGFTSLTLLFFIILRMQREKFFRCRKRDNNIKIVKSSNLFRKFVDIVTKTVLNYLFFDLRNRGFERGMNIYKVFELISMVTLLIIKNQYEFNVGLKKHHKFSLHVFLYLRVFPCIAIILVCGILLYFGNNYSIDQYTACVENKIGELVRRKRWIEITALITRFEVEDLPEHQASIIYDKCSVSIDDLLDQNFSIGQICRLRFPMPEVTRKIGWAKMKRVAKQRLELKIKGITSKASQDKKSPEVDTEEDNGIEFQELDRGKSTKPVGRQKIIQNILEKDKARDYDGITRDFEEDCYFYGDGYGVPFFRIVNFILKNEKGVEGKFDEHNKDLDKMVDALIKNKLNVFLWRMCHKQDADIDVKKYASYNPNNADDFSLFDLEFLDWLYKKEEFLINGPPRPQEKDRKTGFTDIHVLIKFGTRVDQTFELEVDGITEMKADDTAGFFVYKDVRKENNQRHCFLKSAPATLFEMISFAEGAEMKNSAQMQTQVGQTPTITMAPKDLKSFLNLSTGALRFPRGGAPKEVSKLLGEDIQHGWYIIKIAGDSVSDKDFRSKWGNLDIDIDTDFSLEYRKPALCDCTGRRLCGCLCNGNSHVLDRFENSKDWKVGEKVRFKNLPREQRKFFSDEYYGKLIAIQDNDKIRDDNLRKTDIDEMYWDSVKVWQVARTNKNTGKVVGELTYVPACWLAPYTEDIDSHVVELTTGDWGFEINQYDWTLDFNKVGSRGEKVVPDLFRKQEIEEGWAMEYVHDLDEGKKYYVNDSESQEEIVNLLNAGGNLKMKFMPPEKEGFACWLLSFFCFSITLCIPCAWLSYRPYCGRGGMKYSAKELITSQLINKNGKREYLVEDGDILLVSFANPGWLSLSQGGQWGHCGIIFRYKKATLQYLPKRFQTQLENWERRGIIEENTPLVFEMANHGREGDTNEYKVHLSHLQNWHIFGDARKYFGPSIGIRKFTGPRDKNFYVALFQTMHQHHMKPYESVPMEFVCSGLCFFPSTDYETQMKELFCSELVAEFHYRLKYPDETRKEISLLPRHVFPSEFQPSDYGAQKALLPFCFCLCGGLSYVLSWPFGEMRNAYQYKLKDYLGPLLILDCSTIDEWEDEVRFLRSGQGKKTDVKRSEMHINNDDFVRSPTFSGLFHALSYHGDGCQYLDVDGCDDIMETVRRDRLRQLKENQKGLSPGFLLVELTWWFFYIVTFPLGIYIRVRLHLNAVEASKERKHDKKTYEKLPTYESKTNVLEERQTCCHHNLYVLLVGLFYGAAWFSISRMILTFDDASLMELPLYLYFLGIIFLGFEGLCGESTQDCYDSVFRWGFRAFGVKLKVSKFVSQQMAPVKIPFITVVSLSVAILGGFLLNSLGYKRDGVKFEWRAPEEPLYFLGSLGGLIICLYKLCQYVVQSAIGLSPDILMQLVPRSPYRRQEFENDMVDFFQDKKRIEQDHEKRKKLHCLGSSSKTLECLRKDKEAVEDKIKELKDNLNSFQKMDHNKDGFDQEMSVKILRVLMKRELENLQNDLEGAKDELKQIDLAIGKAERKKTSFPPRWKQLQQSDREEIKSAARKDYDDQLETWRKENLENFRERFDFSQDEMKQIFDAYKNRFSAKEQLPSIITPVSRQSSESPLRESANYPVE